MHSVTINSVSYVGDLVSVVGTVDNSPAQTTCWLSHLNSLSSDAARQQYIAQQLVASVPPKPTPLLNLLTASPILVASAQQ